MDAALPAMTTQAILLWTLLGFLVIWMLLFGVLAFRLEAQKQDEESRYTPETTTREAQTSYTSSAPIATSPTAPAMLHIITPQPVATTIGARGFDSSDDVIK